MRNYHKLLELARNNVQITITNNRSYSMSDKWNIDVSKTDDGVRFNIDKYYEDLEEGVDDVYSLWIAATTKGVASHALNVIEHHKPSGDERDKATGEELTGRHDYDKEQGDDPSMFDITISRAP